MLDRLPIELLSLVFSLVARRDSGEHRKALYACSLVSKSVGAVAQRSLWRNIDVDREEQIPSLLAGKGDKQRGENGRGLVYDVKASISLAVSALPHLRSLQLFGVIFEVSDLLAMSGLTSALFPLSVSFVHLSSASQTSSLWPGTMSLSSLKLPPRSRPSPSQILSTSLS
jgi:hypothetical protein